MLKFLLCAAVIYFVAVPNAFAQAPTWSSETGLFSPLGGGATIIIDGNDLAGATVTVNGATATINSNTSTQINFTTPAGAHGDADILITTAGGSVTITAGVYYTYALTLDASFSPSSINVGGTSRLTLTLTKLESFIFTGISFSTSLPAGLTVASVPNAATTTCTSGTLTAVAGSSTISLSGARYPGGQPAGTTCTFSVDVTASTSGTKAVTPGNTGVPTGTVGGTAIAGVAGTPVNLPVAGTTVTNVTPNSGTTAGGTAVTITGTNFTGATAVTVGGAAATSIVVVNATTITAVTPAHAAGVVDVAVTSPTGTGTGTGLYTYATPPAAPTVSSIAPTSGTTAGGTGVTITGTNFTGATAVTVGGAAATSIVVVNATTITAVTPAHTAGVVDVAVTTTGGTGTGSGLYTYVTPASPPTVTSVASSSGNIAGGTAVTITGTSFTGATAVTFGGVAAASIVVVNDTTVTATTPAHAAGAVNVAVTTPAGTGTGTGVYTYVVTPSPTVISASPNSGPTAGGTSVTITGTNLTGATSVTFGGTAATSVVVVNATTITATTPAHASGAVDVAVTTPGGAATGTGLFTYAIGAPSVTAISPTTGPTAGGTAVTITGTNFTGATTVRFGNTAAASFTVNSATSISATSPAGSGVVDITVATAAGTSASSAADQFSYGPPPDSLKVRALQNTITPIIAQTSGQVITTAIDGAINDAFSDSAAPISGGSNGATFNFTAEPRTNGPVSAQMQRGNGNELESANGFAPEAQPNRRINDAFTAMARATNTTKAPPPRPKREWRLWLDVRGTGWTVSDPTADLKGGQINFTLGLTRKLTADLIVGVIGGFESFNYDVASLGGNLKGTGQTVGGYVAHRFGALRIDAALAWSNMMYDAAAGTAAGSFTGSRWLASTGLTGNQRLGGFIIEPSAKIFVLWERQKEWTDSLGTLQDERRFSAGRASGGTKVAHAFDLGDESKFMPFVGVYGDYRFTSDDAVPTGQPVVAISQGWSARVTAGASYGNVRGAMISFGGELGGLGSNYKIWSGNIRGTLPF